MTARSPDEESTATARWEMVVGLEVHVQLKTRSKIFCGCPNEFGAPPNANTCPICLAMPGTLPVLNAHAVELAVRAALALDCTVHPASVFARKNYFYPDLPKGYQISQFDRPLATRGYVAIGTRDEHAARRIGITRVHMEEDAGKSIHDRYEGFTAIDLNRSGTPLIEIVSEPDMHSAAEAGAYCRALKQTLEYIGVSDVNMEKGSLRVDANISIRPAGETRLGTRTELKNLNSFSAVERALSVEYERQVRLLESGERVIQQTLLWDERAQAVRPSRAKEESHDYRYFPEPDLPPLVLAEEWIVAQRSKLPELPHARRSRFISDYGLSEYDAGVLTADQPVANYFEHVALGHGNPKTAANWVMGALLAHIKTSGESIGEIKATPDSLVSLLDLTRQGTIGLTAAKKVFERMLAHGGDPATIARREGLTQVSDAGELSRWLDEVIAEMPNEAERLRNGEQRLQGVLIGAAMKKSKGRADPKQLAQLLSARFGS
jgi:aspartyl-tRNA(Asn)/glutamyl-tRNA(Gln) amidotransferase subunit B